MQANIKILLHNKCRELIIQLNINLRHFPEYESQALCLQIRNSVYLIFKNLNRYTPIKLNRSYKELRDLCNLAFELGYFKYHNNKLTRSTNESLRRYTAISILLGEFSALINKLIRNTHKCNE